MASGVRKGHGSRDSVEVCNYQSDLYYAVRHPNAASRPPRVVPPKDTLENLQQKLEKEAQKKLLQGNHVWASGGLRLVGKGGKLLFLSLILPPYFLIYAFPKFALTKVFPQLLLWAFRPVNRCFQFVAAKAATLQTVVKKLISFFQPKPQTLAKMNGKSLLLRWTKRVGAFYKKITHMATLPFAVTRQLIGAIKKAVKDIGFRIQKAFARMGKAANRSSVKLFERLNDGLHRMIAPIGHLLTPIAKAVKASLSKTYAQTATAFKKIREKIAYVVRNPAQVLTHLVNGLGQWLTQAAYKVSVSATEWMKAGIVETTSILKSLRAQAYDLVSDRFVLAKEQIQSWAHTAQQAARQAAQQSIHILWNGVVYLPQQLIKIVKCTSFAWWHEGRRWVRQRYLAGKGVLQTNFQQVTASLRAGIKRGYAQLSASLSGWAHWIWSMLQKVPSLLWQQVRKLAKLAGGAFIKAVYGLRVAAAWARVLFRYGMELVREAAQELIFTLTRWIQPRDL